MHVVNYQINYSNSSNSNIDSFFGHSIMIIVSIEFFKYYHIYALHVDCCYYVPHSLQKPHLPAMIYTSLMLLLLLLTMLSLLIDTLIIRIVDTSITAHSFVFVFLLVYTLIFELVIIFLFVFLITHAHTNILN